jgi:DNA ligase-1
MYKTLYKRNTNGSVQQWQIHQNGSAYYTISGKYQDGAKLITSADTQCTGKNLTKANSTTDEEQCALEVAALYKKKLESGYVEDISNLDNTGLLKPMLAKVYGDYKDKIKFPIASTAKLDGIRLNALESILYSRNGKEFKSIPHILLALQPVFAKYKGLVLDGEIYSHTYKDSFNTIVSLSKKVKPTAEELAESEKLIQFHIFDCFGIPLVDSMSAIDRKKFIAELVSDLNHKSIVSVPFKICRDYDDIDQAYAEYLEAGYEGQMINLNVPYENRRTNQLLKRKESIDEEFEILDILHGEGRNQECAKLVLKCKSGKFESNVVGTLDYSREVYKNKVQHIGKMATIRFQGWTPDLKPRFPRCVAFRDYE